MARERAAVRKGTVILVETAGLLNIDEGRVPRVHVDVWRGEFLE